MAVRFIVRKSGKEVCDVQLEAGDEFRVVADTQARIGHLVAPITALANAFSGKATFDVAEPSESNVAPSYVEKAQTNTVNFPSEESQ